MVDIGLLGLRMTGVCGLIDLGFDALLGMGFLRQTFFVLNFGKMVLSNPETEMLVNLELMAKGMFRNTNNVIFPKQESFPYETSCNTSAHSEKNENSFETKNSIEDVQNNSRVFLVEKRLKEAESKQPQIMLRALLVKMRAINRPIATLIRIRKISLEF